MSLLTEAVKTDILTRAALLAHSLMLNAPEAANDDAKAFLQRNDAKISRWLSMVSKDAEPKEGQITPEEFASLVHGLKDLEDMEELSKKVQLRTAVDAFASSLISIVIQVGLTAALGPAGAGLVSTVVGLTPGLPAAANS
ncbi:MAG: hypothetical protein JWR15_58 [Prosthecobacter sp.]|nr:hypothetical protein [Prosthecobacter sp.]